MRYRIINLCVLLAILLLFNFINPAFKNTIGSKIVDLIELPLKITTRLTGSLYNLTASRNRYENEISVLEKKVAALTKTSVQMEELVSENERLRGLLSFKSRFVTKGVTAEVIARNQSGWDSFIIIDKGENDGVVERMVVAKPDGVVGRVYEAGKTTAKVMLIDNPNLKMGAVVQRTREQGITVGMGAGLCKLIYLSYDTEIIPGDIVIASETGNSAIKGFIIGEIIKVVKESRSLYAGAIIKPSSNLFKIEEVLCLE